VNPVLRHPRERRVALDGRWRFRLDPDDVGRRERWHCDPARLTAQVGVPGCWQGQGHGSEGTDRVWDFELEARVFRATYRGTGWYGREFAAPAQWRGRRLWLGFGGVHPSAEVWLNADRLGGNDLPFVPFGFEVTGLLRFDAPNQLVVRVHERHREFGLAYNWMGHWSGLYRGVDLTATGPSSIVRCSIYPDVGRQAMRVLAQVDGTPSDGRTPVLQVCAHPIEEPSSSVSVRQPVTAETTEVSLAVPDPRLWSPDQPNLYRVDVALLDDGEVLDALSERVGFVTLGTSGKHFLINGEPYYMRGTGDFVSCPETGCPDADRDRWRKKLRTLRQYGYNYVRCQSYLYPPEYFDAADEVGLLVRNTSAE